MTLKESIVYLILSYNKYRSTVIVQKNRFMSLDFNEIINNVPYVNIGILVGNENFFKDAKIIYHFETVNKYKLTIDNNE